MNGNDAYRSGYEQIVGTRLATLRKARERFASYLPELRAIRAARIARIIGGAFGIAGAAAMALCAATENREGPLVALLAAGFAMAISWLFSAAVLQIGARMRLGLKLPENMPVLTGIMKSDLHELDQSDPVPAIEKKLHRLETWSIALPMIATSLLLPLTLHLIPSPLFGPHYNFARNYSDWIRISLVIVGHAHLALALLSYLFARKMKRASTSDLGAMRVHKEWLKAWGITIGVASVPGIVLLLVPPILVALTGLVFIPAMWILAHSRVLNERRVIEMAVDDASTVEVRVAADTGPRIEPTTVTEEALAWMDHEESAEPLRMRF